MEEGRRQGQLCDDYAISEQEVAQYLELEEDSKSIAVWTYHHLIFCRFAIAWFLATLVLALDLVTEVLVEHEAC